MKKVVQIRQPKQQEDTRPFKVMICQKESSNVIKDVLGITVNSEAGLLVLQTEKKVIVYPIINIQYYEFERQEEENDGTI